MSGRPWVVFVRDVGPTFTFAHGDRARERAAELVTGDGGAYLEVLVYSRADLPELSRTVYHYNRPPQAEVWTGSGWARAPEQEAHADD